jgi:magnesium transporter
VVTVVFMPPTLIASMYGMNFQFMPELDELWGYPFAIILMVLSSFLTLLFFKRKKWL